MSKIPPVQEPIRKSYFDVMRNSMQKAGRVNFLHRIIYIGRHTFPGNEIVAHFETNIKKVHTGYYDEKLTGILLYYPSYFCHILDGSEDTIFRHISLLLRSSVAKEHIGTIKVLVFYHHINQRFRDNWIYLTARPQTLFEKIDQEDDLDKITTRIKACIRKIYNLAFCLRPKPKKEVDIKEDNSEEEECAEDETEPDLSSLVTPDCLPEYAMLDFLIETKLTYPIQFLNDVYGKVPTVVDRKDAVWPIPTDFVPVHLFDTYTEPIPDIKLPDLP